MFSRSIKHMWNANSYSVIGYITFRLMSENWEENQWWTGFLIREFAFAIRWIMLCMRFFSSFISIQSRITQWNEDQLQLTTNRNKEQILRSQTFDCHYSQWRIMIKCCCFRTKAFAQCSSIRWSLAYNFLFWW